MNKFMTLLLASSFLAAAPVFAFEGVSMVGNEEYVLPEIDPGFGPINTPEEEMFARRSCPRGWDRVPQYRWNHRTHRWEFSGWTCRRGHGRGPGHGGPGDNNGGNPGHGGGGGYPGNPGHGGGGGRH